MSDNQIFLARDYYKRGNSAAALKIIEEVNLSPSNPEHIEGLILLKDILHDLDRFDEAYQIISELMKSFPENHEVIDGAISLLSCNKKTAYEAEKLCFERIKRLPESCWSYYILAHVYFYHLDKSEGEVIENIDKALNLNNYTYYLDNAFVFYDYYDRSEKRDFCLEQMMKLDPNSEKTRAKLYRNLISKKLYREAAEVALSFFKDFPISNAISNSSIESLKDNLAKTNYQKYVSKIHSEIRTFYRKYVYYKPLYVRSSLGILLRIVNYLILPYRIPSIISSKNYIHIAAMRKDELYRRLCSSRDHILEGEWGALIYCPHSKGDVKVMYFVKNGVHIADDLNCSISQAASEYNVENFVNPKSYMKNQVKELKATHSIVSVESSWTIDDLEYASPETVLHLENSLKKLEWKSCNSRATELLGSVIIIKILAYTTAGVGVGIYSITNGLILPSIYAAGIPAICLLIYLKNLIFTTRTYSYRPRMRSRLVKNKNTDSINSKKS